MTSPLARYAAATVGIVVVVGVGLSLVFRGRGDAAAIAVSGVIAVIVQLTAFVLSRTAGQGNLMARMGTGALLRLLTLIAYALVVAKVLTLPLAAALVSLALFYFLSTLIEPLLIKS